MANDPNHEAAANIYEQLIDHEQEVWTTSCILIEVLSFAYGQLSPEEVSKIADSILSNIHIYWLDNIIFNEAWSQVDKQFPKYWRLEDWITAIVAKHLRAYVFTFNGYL